MRFHGGIGMVNRKSRRKSTRQHKKTCVVKKAVLQSRPIQMRGTILYHANRWMDFKMLSTPNRFLDLLRVLLLPFC